MVREVDEELGASIVGLAFLSTVENIFQIDGVHGHEVVFLYSGRLAPQPSLLDAHLTESDGTVVPVACDWASIEAEVHAYLRSYYEPGDLLPVTILVQFERTTGRYRVTFEDTDEERWKTRPRNFREMRELLRPSFD